MVVRIRLARWGRRNRPFYRIVAADARARRDGRFIENLGTYNPLPHSHLEATHHVKRVALNVSRIKYWLSVGAQPTPTMTRLLGTSGILPLSPRSARPFSSLSASSALGFAATSSLGSATAPSSSPVFSRLPT